jgi:phosphate starvation-inducible PhoH-like protein
MGRRRRDEKPEPQQGHFQKMEMDDRPVPAPRNLAPIKAKTYGQSAYMKAIETKKLIFGIGPAGTGKTFVATALAADRLKAREIDKLILTRPAIEAGESLGFLPGEMDEKFDPYFRPVRNVLEARLGKGFTEYAIKSGKIEALPLAYMRGHTFDRCFVLLDEAQNTTPVQMKMFLTRIGEESTVVVDGDPTQKDIRGPSGLLDAVDRMDGHPDVAVVRFTREDVVRSGLVQDILVAYENPEDETERDGLRRVLTR